MKLQFSPFASSKIKFLIKFQECSPVEAMNQTEFNFTLLCVVLELLVYKTLS